MWYSGQYISKLYVAPGVDGVMGAWDDGTIIV